MLLEGTEAGAHADCASPEIRILTSNPGRASLFPGGGDRRQGALEPGRVLETGDGRRRRWTAGGALAALAAVLLALRADPPAPGLAPALPAALDGQRPNTISLANDGQFWPAGEIRSEGGADALHDRRREASTLQRLSGYGGKANLGELVAVPAEPHRIVPLSAACNAWIDWYEPAEAP